MTMGCACLDQFLNVVVSVFDAYSTVLFLPDEESEGYRLAGKFSLGEHIADDTVIMPGQGLVGWIMRNSKPLLINEFDRKRSHLGYYLDREEDKIKAFMGCPLPDGGALCIDSMRSYIFSEKDQKILQLFCSLAHQIGRESCLIEQCRSDQHFYHAFQLLSSLRKRFPRWGDYLPRFLGALTTATGFEFAFLAERDENGQGYFLEGVGEGFFSPHVPVPERFPIKGGLVGWAFNNGQPVFVGDREQAPVGQSLFGRDVAAPQLASLVLLPLQVHRITRAVLVLASPQHVPMDEDMRIFLEMAADNLSLYLDYFYLYTRLSRLDAE